jgi:PadR family transcriptional regulator PadR
LTPSFACLVQLGMQGEALKGHLALLLLGVVRDSPAHGYAIIEELRRSSGGALDLPEGTVYPALHRLEKAGLLASRWSEEGGVRQPAGGSASARRNAHVGRLG